MLSAVAGRRLPAVTCGLGTSDTLTLSSFTVDSAVISLQRQLTAFDGTPVEPFELPVSFSGKLEPFELLAAAAIFCLMGKQNPLAAAPLWRIPPGPAALKTDAWRLFLHIRPRGRICEQGRGPGRGAPPAKSGGIWIAAQDLAVIIIPYALILLLQTRNILQKNLRSVF